MPSLVFVWISTVDQLVTSDDVIVLSVNKVNHLCKNHKFSSTVTYYPKSSMYIITIIYHLSFTITNYM